MRNRTVHSVINRCMKPLQWMIGELHRAELFHGLVEYLVFDTSASVSTAFAPKKNHAFFRKNHRCLENPHFLALFRGDESAIGTGVRDGDAVDTSFKAAMVPGNQIVT